MTECVASGIDATGTAGGGNDNAVNAGDNMCGGSGGVDGTFGDRGDATGTAGGVNGDATAVAYDVAGDAVGTNDDGGVDGNAGNACNCGWNDGCWRCTPTGNRV